MASMERETQAMTWGEFCRQVDAQGVIASTPLLYVDMSGILERAIAVEWRAVADDPQDFAAIT